MILATHQPIFLPWPGFFFKAMQADRLVLLDQVQFPRGRGWMNRNRLKSEQGELWLTVPVHKKGRGLQTVQTVEIFHDNDWRKKHLRSISQNYARAPYLAEYFPQIESVYQKKYRLLVEFNLALISLVAEALSLQGKLLLQSQLNATGKGTDLLVDVCKKAQAQVYLTFPGVQKYLDLEKMARNGIQTTLVNFHPPVYPQLWGDFIYNLSTLDLLLNCGPKSGEIVGKC
ncbi:MAG: WbqC family protein [bacterium]